MTPLAAIFATIGLLMASALALFLEILLPSGGLLMLTSLGLAIASVLAAFSAGTLAGWITCAVLPVIGIAISHIAIRQLQRSSVVPQEEITADAGIHHQATAIGVNVGSTGVLVTDLLPSGRARFPEGDLDVQAVAGRLDRGTPIQVVRFDGASIFVTAVATTTPDA